MWWIAAQKELPKGYAKNAAAVDIDSPFGKLQNENTKNSKIKKKYLPKFYR
jgi:hypothetical protein